MYQELEYLDKPITDEMDNKFKQLKLSHYLTRSTGDLPLTAVNSLQQVYLFIDITLLVGIQLMEKHQEGLIPDEEYHYLQGITDMCGFTEGTNEMTFVSLPKIFMGASSFEIFKKFSINHILDTFEKENSEKEWYSEARRHLSLSCSAVKTKINTPKTIEGAVKSYLGK